MKRIGCNDCEKDFREFGVLMAEESTVSTTDVQPFEADYGPDETEDFVTTLSYEMETKSESAIVPTTSDAIVATSFEPTVAGVSFQVNNCNVDPAAVIICDSVII